MKKAGSTHHLAVTVSVAVACLLLWLLHELRPQTAAPTQALTEIKEESDRVASAVAEHAEPTKVTFIGDSTIFTNTRRVLRLAQLHNATVLSHQGDVDYNQRPAQFFGLVSEIVGRHVPLMFSVGNAEWATPEPYSRMAHDRLTLPLRCDNDATLGIKSHCVVSGPHTTVAFVHMAGWVPSGRDRAQEFVSYIRQSLSGYRDHVWKVCSFHVPPIAPSDLGKENPESLDTARAIAEECVSQGAVIVTAHKHYYARSHPVSSVNPLRLTPKSTGDQVRIAKGSTVLLISGLGGASIGKPQQSGAWAAVYPTSKHLQPQFGALQCTFREDKANCDFQLVDGSVIDRVELVR